MTQMGFVKVCFRGIDELIHSASAVQCNHFHINEKSKKQDSPKKKKENYWVIEKPIEK